MERFARQPYVRVAVVLCLLVVEQTESGIAEEAQHSPSAGALRLGDELAVPLQGLSWSPQGIRWTTIETANFRIFTQGVSLDEAMALGEACEKCLLRLNQVWLPHIATGTWQPKCVVVCHRTPESFDQAVGNVAAGTWGRTLARRCDGHVVERRIDVCTPTLRRLVETLPHELTHVILADHFPREAVPRWLDEGAAVMAEPSAKKSERASAHALQSGEGPVFRSAELLLAESYPTGTRRELFYAESHQLICLLLAQGDAARLTAFAKSAVHMGYEAALREHYGLQSLAHLDRLRQQESKAAGLVSQASRERNVGINRAALSSEGRIGRVVNTSYHRATPIRREHGN